MAAWPPSLTKRKRIKFEFKKNNVLVVHVSPAVRKDIKKTPIYLDRNKQEQFNYTKHANLLGITFSETETFHKHINKVLKITHGRLKQTYRFAGHIKGDTLYKVYITTIEPIVMYGTEVLYENFTCNTVKKLNALEFTAIKVAYRLPRQIPTIDCLDYLKDGGIADRLNRRRDNFVENITACTRLLNIHKEKESELGTLEWWISGLMLNPLFLLIS